MKKRILRVLLGMAVLSVFILIRAAHLQLVGDDRLTSLAKRQFESRVLVRPKRGLILDRNGDLLAANDETRSLAADPSKVRNANRVARKLSRLVGVPAHEIEEKLRSRGRFVWIKRHLAESVTRRLRDLDEGLWLVEESLRIYPHGSLAGQVLGTVNLDSEGLEGIELSKDAVLRGNVVSIRAIKDAMGRPSFLDAKAAADLKHGTNIHLTLDSALQFEVERELLTAVTKHGARSGIAVVMNASNGDIAALAHVPLFDPKHRGASLDHRRIRTVADGFEPGSVMKPLLMAAALQSGVKSTDLEWGGLGETFIQGRRIGEAEEHETFGWLSLGRMVTVSSNVVAARFALRVGAHKYFSALRQFGFASRTGVELPGEISGALVSADVATPLRLANIGFGQGLLVTPVQLCRAYAALFAGGLMPKPRLDLSAPVVKERVMPESVAFKVSSALESVVVEKDGTGKAAAVPGYRVAGKTATAQTVDPATRRYSTSHYIASFTGALMAPETNWVISVILDRPTPKYYAGEVAAPLFRAVAERVAIRFGVPSQSPVTPLAGIKPSPTTVDSIKTTRARAVTISSPRQMPDLSGLAAREALDILTARGLKVRLEGFGTVVEQTPAPGVLLEDGQAARVRLSE